MEKTREQTTAGCGNGFEAMPFKKMKHSENSFFETGRSMVEMLGVLAIIGVLSIGGIVGYKYSVNRYEANQILYELNLTSVQLAMQLQKGDATTVNLSLGSPYESGKMNTVKYAFTYACGNDLNNTDHDCKERAETGFYMIVSGVPEGVCKLLKENVETMQYYSDMVINNDDKKSPCAPENEFAAFFDIEYGGPNGKPVLPDQTPNQPEETRPSQPDSSEDDAPVTSQPQGGETTVGSSE